MWWGVKPFHAFMILSAKKFDLTQRFYCGI